MDEAQGPEQDRPAAGDKKKVKALAKMLEIRLKQTHGRVSITSVPDGAFVRVTLEKSGEVVEGSTPLAEWLPFGAHQIEARKDGYLVFTRGLLVQPRMVPEVVIELKAEETGEAGAGAAGQPEAGQEAAVEAAAAGEGRARGRAGRRPAAGGDRRGGGRGRPGGAGRPSRR